MFSQESLRFKDISRHSFYTIEKSETPLPDDITKDNKYLQNEKMYKMLGAFIEYHEKLDKEFSELELLNKEENKVKKDKLLKKFSVFFKFIKNNDKLTSHYRDIELHDKTLLKKTKLERERFKIKLTDFKFSEGNKLPKDIIKLKFLREVNISTKIKGEYIVAGKVNVATKNSVKDNIYKNQILEKIINNDYTIYTHYKSVDGSGVSFYNNTIDIYNEYMVERAPRKLSKKEVETKRKVKLYLKQADPYLKKMYNGILARKNFTLTKSKRIIWVNATKQVKLIDKKIRALYGNDDDNYYDFQKLLDTKTIEDKIYFDTVLNNSKQMLGMK